MPLSFPTVTWGERQVTFNPFVEGASPARMADAALVFAFYEDRIVLADIRERGWCIPGGRLEPGEDAEAAARREAWEEAGITLGELVALGATVSRQPNDQDRVLAISHIASVVSFSPIPAMTEAQGIRLAARHEVRKYYYIWDDLIEAMFDYAWERQSAR